MKTPLFGEEAATQNKFILFRAVQDKKPRIANPNVPVRLLALCSRALDKNPDCRIQSVALQDFLADADDVGALRRRVARGGTRAPAVTAPSLAVWGQQVRTWIGMAARLEKQALGAARISPNDGRDGLGWSVKFANAGSPVFVEVLQTNLTLAIQVLSDTEPPVGTVVFEIGPEGPDMGTADIPAALAAQYLYALDLCLASQRSEPVAMEAAR
jgi:hypothetical protein